MERIKANIFLVLIVWVQFGSTGFVYYKNVCSDSQSTSISFKDVGCCCATKDVSSCCGPKDVSCCSGPKVVGCSSSSGDGEEFNNKCCYSHECFKQTSDDFPNSEFQFQFELALIDLPELSKFVLSQNHFTQEVNNGLYPCHSPPIRHVDTRIFIQSFQI